MEAMLNCSQVLSRIDELRVLDEAKRRRFLNVNPNYLKHQAFGAICHGNEISGFAFIDRDVELLAREPAIICLQFTDSKAQIPALTALKHAHDVRFVLLNTPVFAYEPVLKELKVINDHPLHQSLLNPQQTDPNSAISFRPDRALETFSNSLHSKADTHGGICLDGTTRRLDKSQCDSLKNALTNAVSAIQGPPGEYHQMRH